jgi:putative ABC transport system permease protein
MTGFSFRMAWRETRAAWRHFLYFFVCIALGVGALVGVALFSANVERAVTREARGLMGGDVEIRLSRPMSGKGEAVLRSLADRGIAVLHVSELVGMAAVVDGTPALQTQLVELKAVESGYPLYGNLQLEPQHPLMAPGRSRHSSLVTRHGMCHGAVVQQSLLIRLGLSVGNRFKVGDAIFTITGVLRIEPDRVAGPFNLGPRVMVSREGLAAAELIKPGSRVRERYLLKIPQALPASPLLYELRGRLAGESARVTGYRDAQPQLKRFLDQLTRYLGLIGLTALFIGGIGVATTIHAFIREKLQTIAVLKAVGAESGTVIRTYLLQALLLGAIGSLAGGALGAALQHALPPLVTGLFGADLLAQLDFSGAINLPSLLPMLKGIALGILTTLLFTLWPLLGIRDVSPARIFRRDVQTGSHTVRLPRSWWLRLVLTDPVRLLAALGIGAGLAGLAVWQAGNWRIGLLFIGALATAVTLLTFSASLLIRAIRTIPGPRSVAIRHAMGNLYRPGSQAMGVMVSFGIGVMVIVAVSLLERTLVDQVGESRPVDSPSFFFIDIQPDQKEALLSLLRERTHDPAPETTPLVRSRLHAINGRPVATAEETEHPHDKQQDRRKHWYLTREYVLTFLHDLPRDNRVSKGEWWQPGQMFSKPLVSIEEDAARNLGVDLGSTLTFEIQGTTIEAEVSSIRKVEWGNFSTNFYMIFSPGSLDGAPFTYVATVRVPPEQEVPLQQAVVASFPNITAINIGDVLDSFARILDRLALAIRAIAVFCILAGALVMAAALAATRYRRLYESVVLKALGATRGLIARSFAVEYALVGAAAGLIGTALASLLSWAVLKFILEDVSWTLQPEVLAVGFILTLLLSLVVGFLSTFRILGQRPLAVLRHE